MILEIPKSLKLEHQELHEDLEEAISESGPIGEAAKAVNQVLQPHFEKEEEFALPPLGLLPNAINELSPPETNKTIEMTNRLESEIDQMLREHKEIVSRLKGLIDAALKEDKTEYVRFAEKLTLHAQTEEELLYPAAIMLGEYLKIRLLKKKQKKQGGLPTSYLKNKK